MMLPEKHSRIQPIDLDLVKDSGLTLAILREDELHPHISGNKYRKLKYNLHEANKLGYDTLLTFGGAYSNHIAATAAAGKEFGFKTIGIIRGDELAGKLDTVLLENSTLKFATEQGMELGFLDRTEYRLKYSPDIRERLDQTYGKFYLVPEGGTNDLAVKGCEEILGMDTEPFDVICCAVGTGGTLAGLINASGSHQSVIGFPALKGDFLTDEIQKYIRISENWSLNTDYHFGGYAKITNELIAFMNAFKKGTGIPLDPVYTGKMMYGVMDLIKQGHFKEESRILTVHTGGLQGIEGMNDFLKKKHLPLLV